MVAIDYSTQWIEVGPLTTITAKKVHKFFWKNVICRHSLLHCIIIDNSRQFTNNDLNIFLQQVHFKHRVSSMKHSQTNGQVEITNKDIINKLKKKLKQVKGHRID